MPADDLAGFMAELRRRLEAGELANHPPIDLELGSGPQNAEALALRMLREVKAFRSMPPEQRTSEPVRSMRRELAEELRRLREQLR